MNCQPNSLNKDEDKWFWIIKKINNNRTSQRTKSLPPQLQIKLAILIMVSSQCFHDNNMGSQSSIPTQQKNKVSNTQLKEEDVDWKDLTAENIVFSRTQTIFTAEEQDLIFNCVKQLSFIGSLKESQIIPICQQFRKCTNGNNEWIFKEGSIANYFFIIAEGEVEVIKDGYYTRSLGVGQCFGELALLYGIRRSSSIKVSRQNKNKNRYFALKKSDFAQIMAKVVKLPNEQFYQRLLLEIPFRYYTKRELRTLSEYSNLIMFRKNDKIMTRFDEPYALFFIRKGEVKISLPGKKQLFLRPGETFGFYGSNEIQYSAIAHEDTECFAIGKQNLKAILKKNIIYLFLWNKVSTILYSNSPASEVSSESIKILTSHFRFKWVQQKEVICRHHSPVDKFYITSFFNSEDENQGQLVGYNEFCNKQLYYSKDLVAQQAGYCAEISVNAFIKFMNQNCNSCYFKEKAIALAFSESEIVRFEKKLPNQCEVLLCRQKRFDRLFLLECVKKLDFQQVLKMKMKLAVLQKLRTKFISHYYCYEQTQSECLLKLEFIEGVTLKDVICDIGLLPLSMAKFYIASLIVALEHSHKNGIIWRNFNLENFKVDNKGYIWLFNISNCCLVSHTGKQNLNLIVNNWFQLAPEVVQGEQFGIQSDYWGLGIVIYLVLLGNYPFGANEADPVAICRAVLEDEIQFPINFKNKSTRQLLSVLLNKSKSERSKLSWSSIKCYSFFRGVDWAGIEAKTIEPPYLPKTSQIWKGVI